MPRKCANLDHQLQSNGLQAPDSADSLSRRGFLISACSSLCLSANALSASTSSLQPEEGRVVVGAHPWVYAATLPDYDPTPVLSQIFSDMSYAGLDGVELMDSVLKADDSVEKIRKLSDRHQLPVIGTSFGADMWDRASHPAILREATLVITRLAKVGGKTFGTSVGATPRRKTDEQLDAQADLLGELIAVCQVHGIELNLHNHTYEVKDGLHDLKGTLKRLPEARLGPDLNWLIRGGVDPVEYIRQFGRRIVFLHLRDQSADGTWSEAVGEGATDFKAIGKELKAIGFSGYAVIELAHENKFQPTRPLRESLKISREYVREVLGY